MCFNSKTWATRLYLLCFLLSFPLLEFAQQFQRRYKPALSSETFQVTGFNSSGAYGRDRQRPTPDGGYIRISNLRQGPNNEHIALLKTDNSGAIVWSKTLAGSGKDFANDILLDSDGGYLICGHSTSGSLGATDALLVKTDALGNVLWSKSYGISGNARFNCMLAVSGGYVLAGFTNAISNVCGGSVNCPSAMVIRTDANGNLLNQLIAKNNSASEVAIHDIVLDKTGGFVATGRIGDDLLLLKTTAQLQLSWMKRYTESPGPISLSIQANAIEPVIGGFLMAGTMNRGQNTTDTDLFLLKTDDQGNALWAKLYGSAPGRWDVASDLLTNATGFFISGTCEVPASSAVFGSRGYLVATDLNGNLVWDKQYGSSNGSSSIFSIEASLDGGFILGGYLYKTSNNSWYATAIKANEVGVSGCQESELSSSVLSIFPTEVPVSPNTFGGLQQANVSIGQTALGLDTETPCVTYCLDGDLTASILGNPILCNGASSATLTASSSNGTAPYTYVWSNGGDDASIDVSSNGTYSVTISDDKGCTGTAEVTVTTANGPQVNLSSFPGSSVCQDESLALVAFHNSTTPVSFSWYEASNPTAILGSGQAFPAPTNAPGAFSYCVEVNSGNGCPTVQCISVSVDAAPALAGLASAYCESSGLAPIVGTGSFQGQGTFSSNPAGAVTSTSIGSFTAWSFDPSVGPGTYEVTYCLTASGCCVSQMVTVDEEVNNISYGQICTGDPCVDLSNLVNAAGANFSGPGVSGEQFCPNSLSPGYYSVDYCLPGQNACGGCAEITFQVVGSNGGWPKLAAEPNQNVRNEVGEAMVQGPDGSFYMTGHFTGSIEFDQNHQFNALNANGSGNDLWVVKYSECGVEWAITASNHLGWLANRSAIPTDILIYKGRVFVSVNVKTNNISKGHLLALNSTDGSLNANFGDQTIGTTQPNQTLANRIAVRPEILSAKGGGQQDLIYVTGAVKGRISFARMNQVLNGTYQSIEGTNDIYYATYNMAGGQNFMTTQGGKGEDIGHGIDVFGDGSAVIAGELAGQASGGSCSWPMPIVNNGTGASSDVFVGRYNPNGCESWMLMNGSSKDDRGIDVKIDANNNVLVLGTYERVFSPVQFGLGTTVALNGVVGNEDLFLVRYHGPTGAGMGGVGIGSSWNQEHTVRPHSLWYERSTNSAYASGSFKGTLSFAGNAFSTNSNFDSDPFVMRFEASSLNQSWAAQGKTPGNSNDRDLGTDVIGDGLGNAYLTGGFQGQIGFSPQPLLGSAAFTDFFAVRVGNNGSFYKTVEAATGLQSVPQAATGLKVVPNPNHGRFNVVLDREVQGNAELSILDLNGKVLALQHLASGVHAAGFDLEGLSGGIYLLRYSNGSQQLIRRVVVQ